MNRKFYKLLLCGAAVLATGFFSSCYDDSALKEQMNGVQAALLSVQEQLGGVIKTGASVVDVQTDEEGNATSIVLSDGRIVSLAGGGSDVTVTVNDADGTVTIIVGEEEYVIPLGAAVNSLVFRPEYADGIVDLNSAGATVQFLATPAPSAEALRNAKFTVVDAYELKTRAGGDLFAVADVTIEGGILQVPIRGIAAQAGKTYSVVLQMIIGGTAISSDYFTIKVSDDFSFDIEDLVTPTWGEGFTATQDGDFWLVTLPENETFSFLNAFSFADIFQIPGATNVVYQIGSTEESNGNVNDKRTLLEESLSPNGAFALKSRPGTNFDKKNAEDQGQDGVLVYATVNFQRKAKVYFKVVDPLKDVAFPQINDGKNGGEVQRSNEQMWNAGNNELDLNQAILDVDTFFPTQHNKEATVALVAAYKAYTAKAGDETILAFSSVTQKLTPRGLGERMARLSRGVYWGNANWCLVGKTGEIPSGWDGISAQVMQEWGLSIDPAGIIKTTAPYTGTGMRVAPNIRYEYAYGEKTVFGGPLMYIWINRTAQPEEGVVYPEPK